MGGSRREAQSPPKRKHCASHTDPGCRTGPGVPPVPPPSPHRLGVGISPLGTAPANSQGRRQSAGPGLRPFPVPHLPTTQLCIPTPGPPLGPGGPQMNENEGHPACTEVNSVRSGLLRSTSATQTGANRLGASGVRQAKNGQRASCAPSLSILRTLGVRWYPLHFPDGETKAQWFHYLPKSQSLSIAQLGCTSRLQSPQSAPNTAEAWRCGPN